jgi:hypothetical protein
VGFHDVTQRTFGQANVNELVLGVYGEEYQLRRKTLFTKLSCRIDSAQFRHGNIGHDNVWLQAYRFRQHFPTGAGVTHDVEVGLQEGPHSLQNEFVIICHQDSRAFHV